MTIQFPLQSPIIGISFKFISGMQSMLEHIFILADNVGKVVNTASTTLTLWCRRKRGRGRKSLRIILYFPSLSLMVQPDHILLFYPLSSSQIQSIRYSLPFPLIPLFLSQFPWIPFPISFHTPFVVNQSISSVPHRCLRPPPHCQQWNLNMMRTMRLYSFLKLLLSAPYTTALRQLLKYAMK